MQNETCLKIQRLNAAMLENYETSVSRDRTLTQQTVCHGNKNARGSHNGGSKAALEFVDHLSKMAHTVISSNLPPDIDITKAPLAYGDRAIPKLVGLGLLRCHLA